MIRLILSAMLVVSVAFAGCAAPQQPSGQPKKAVEPKKAAAPAKAAAEPKKAVEPQKPAEPKPVAAAPTKPAEPKPAVEAKKPAEPVAAAEPKKAEPKKAAPPKVAAAGKGMTLDPTKDARVFGYPSENNRNGGGGTRLRTSGIQRGSGEISLIDFDHAALKAFVEKNAGKEIAAKLVLQVMQVQEGPGKVEVAALDSGSDWTEGKKTQTPADKGEVTFLAAQHDTKGWTTTDGKPVKDLRELLYDKKADKVLTMLNSKSAEVSDKDKTVTIELDAKLIEHMASDPNNRGLVLFNRSPLAKVDFSSREKSGSGPKLELAVK